MSIHSVFDGGKQFNCIQSGAFEGRCYAARLRVQVGPTWQLQTLKHTTEVSSSKVLEAAVKRNVTQLEEDRDRKTTEQYKVQCKSSKYIKTPSLQHDYGTDSHQPDVTPEELDHLCFEFFEHEVRVTVEQAWNIEEATKQQSATPEWYHQRCLRLTASNFGRIARRRDTTPVANVIKSLLYSRPFDAPSLRWGRTHEEDARKAYIQDMAPRGEHVHHLQSGLVID